MHSGTSLSILKVNAMHVYVHVTYDIYEDTIQFYCFYPRTKFTHYKTLCMNEIYNYKFALNSIRGGIILQYHMVYCKFTPETQIAS